MNNSSIKEDFINMIGIRHEEVKNEAALYIMDKYPKVFTKFDVAKKVATMIIDEHDATVENFKQGQMDYQIRKYAELEKMRKQSKKGSKEESYDDVKLKIRKKAIAKNTMIGLVVGVLATTGIAYGVKSDRKNLSGALKKEGEIVLPTDEPFIGNPDYESVTNIVEDNTVVAGVLQDGSQVYSHKYDQMAIKILEYYENEPEKLDYYLNDVFKSFRRKNAFKDMDYVLFEIIKIADGNEKYKDLDEIKEARNYAKYIVNKLDYNDPNYDDVLVAISNYENNKMSEKDEFYLDYLAENYNNKVGLGGRK